MAPRGRPPVPAEVKRRRGTARPDRMPHQADVIPLRPADGVPAFPEALEDAGRQLWRQIWEAAAVWLWPGSDAAMVEMACELADGRAAARRRYLATREPADARAWVSINAELRASLSALGFDPTARSRLGVAEVKAASAIDRLIERREKRLK